MAVFTVRNSVNGQRQDVGIQLGQTVREAVEGSGFVTGDFSVRDKSGRVIDSDQVSAFEGQVVNVGLRGNVVGGQSGCGQWGKVA